MTDPAILEALERAIEGLNQSAKALLEQSRRSAAHDRLVISLIALVARDRAEPLKFLDEVRTMALGTLREGELEEVKLLIEGALAKVEGAIIKAKGGD